MLPRLVIRDANLPLVPLVISAAMLHRVRLVHGIFATKVNRLRRPSRRGRRAARLYFR